jgi:hypothetical protein
MEPMDWIMGDDTGTSSKVIFSVMMGTRPPSFADVPLDPDDFGRCFRLLCHFPIWRYRLDEVVERFPAWVGLVREWDKLTELYRAKKNHELYDLMQTLRDEGMLADGWTQRGKGSWSKEGGGIRVSL